MIVPALSVVIPVHNEARWLLARVETWLGNLPPDTELVLVENGSTDATRRLAHHATRKYKQVRVLTWPAPDYGQALRHGLRHAACDRVAFANLDFCDPFFLGAALKALDCADLVLGSKVLGRDERPWLRRAITRGFNGFLRAVFGLRASDTHGLKLLRRAKVLPLADACLTSGWLWDTELVLRAERAGLRIAEVPAIVAEVRGHGVWSLARRVPSVVAGLVKMRRALR